MGDVLGAVLGGGQRTSQDTRVDPTTQALNRMRFQQLGDVFSQLPAGSITGDEGAYTPSGQVQDLYNFGTSAGDTSGLMGFGDYRQSGTDFLNRTTADAMANARANAEATYGGTAADFQNSMARSEANRALGLTGREADFQRGYSNLIDAGSNYVNRIATPQIQQQMAMMGMEGGGATPAAIAQASAQSSLQAMQGLVQQYMQSGMDINQATAAAQAQLGGQYMGQQAATGNQLAQTQAGLQGQQMELGNQFQQSLPGASINLSMAPEQQRALRAQTAQGMFPLADYSRGLKEQSLAGRRGLFTTALTGIPYTPETSVKGRQSQQPLFNFFGQG